MQREAHRSEAVRDLIRKRPVAEEEDPKAESAATLTLANFVASWPGMILAFVAVPTAWTLFRREPS